MDTVPGLGPVDAGSRLAGIRGRSQREGQTLASELGTDHFDPILDEPNLVLHAGDDHALEPGELPLCVTLRAPNPARFGPTTPTRARRLYDASVDHTEARCDGLKGIVSIRPPACRAVPLCRPAKPGQSG